jgi:probable HAF family extracellular repeat protein
MVNLGLLPGGSFSGGYGISADGTTVVGQAGTSTTGVIGRAFKWTEGTGLVGLGTMPGWTDSIAYDVSADGMISVGYAQTPGFNRAIVWDPSGAPTDLGSGRILASSADAGILVGEDSSISQAILWDSHGRQLLESLLGAALPSGWRLHSAQAVSADGRTVAGYGANPQGVVEAWVATIPEPAGFVLLTLMPLVRRRRRS